jgi:hypothetical protein
MLIKIIEIPTKNKEYIILIQNKLIIFTINENNDNTITKLLKFFLKFTLTLFYLEFSLFLV